MRNCVLVISFLFSLSQAFSHSPNEVSFSIYEEGTFILVDAEFPWALRNAVFMFDPSLSQQSTVQDIQNSLFRYIEENLILTDSDGKTIKLLKVIDKKGKSHHEEYQLTFEKKSVMSIRNTLLFNFSSKQKNFHLVELNGEKLEFILTPNNPEFLFKKERTNSVYLVGIIGLIGLLLAVFSFKKIKASF